MICVQTFVHHLCDTFTLLLMVSHQMYVCIYKPTRLQNDSLCLISQGVGRYVCVSVSVNKMFQAFT